jgi:hypothetical protein
MSHQPPSDNVQRGAAVLIPAPPKDSCFTLDTSADGRTRLSWDLAGGGQNRSVAISVLTIWLFLWSALVAFIVLGPGTPREFGPLAWIGCFALWSIAGMIVARLLYCFLRPPKPERLVFTADVLLHDPGSFTYSDWASPHAETTRFWRSEPVMAIRRSTITGVRVETAAERQRLLIDINSGARQIEIGRFLNGRDRWWLAEVLRAWACAPTPSDLPSLPRPLRPSIYRFSNN